MNKMNYFKFLPGITTAIVIILVLYLTYLVLKPFIFVIVIAFIFSIFLNPVYEWFLIRTKKKFLAAGLSLFLLLLGILLPFSFILGGVVQEARGLLHLLQEKPTLLADIQKTITGELQSYGFPPYIVQFDLQKEVVELLKTIVQNIGASLLYAGSIFLNTFLVLITTFFFLIQKKRINSYLTNIEILPHHYFVALQERIIQLVNGVVRGNLLAVAIQMVIGMIGFLVFGVPAPILLGVVYGLLSLLPTIGVLLVWVPVAILLFVNQGLPITLFFISWFVLTNLAVDNLVTPKIIGHHTKLHQVLIMFSVIGGIQQFGFIGIVLGPVIVALAFVVVAMYNELVEESKIL